MRSSIAASRRAPALPALLVAVLLLTACAQPAAPASAPTAPPPPPTSPPAAAPTSAPAPTGASAPTAASAPTPAAAAAAPTSAGATAATPAGTPAAAGQMQFAWAGPLTGDAAQYGQDWLAGIQMAADEWNAKGGLLGKQIVIKPEDEQCDPKQAATVAQKIADDPDTVFVFGHFCSGATLAAAPAYVKANVPFMTTSSNPKITQQGWKNVFRGGPTDNDQGGLGVGYVMDKLGLKKFALLNDKQAFGQGVTDVAKATIEKGGGTVTSYGGVEPKDVDYSAVLTKIVQAEQPDAIMYCTNFPTSAGLMIKQARQLGFQGPIVGCDGYFDPAVVKTAGDVANRTSDTDLVVITFPVPPYDSSPALQAFAKNFQARYGHEPRDFEVFGYDYANVAFAGIQKAGSTDHQKVIETLHTVSIPGVFVPEYKFDEKGDLIGSKFLLWTIEGGKIVLLK